jgi:chromate transporter
MYGIKPVVIAIIVQALWGLGVRALAKPGLILVGLGVLRLYLPGENEIGLLFGGGLIVMFATNAKRILSEKPLALFSPLGGTLVTQIVIPFSMPILFLTFLKIGAILYGSGYVLLAFLRADFVLRLGWLTDPQLLDEIAIGQITPGPLFTSATFIGYLLGGISRALLATLGIFLPSFIFVAISNPLIPRIRNSIWLSSLLDGVYSSALGLMAGVTIQLVKVALTDLYTILLLILALFLLLRYKINSTGLITGGAMLGIVLHLAR